MEVNRNQYFLVGMVLFLLGLQLRLVDSALLTPECTKILSSRSKTLSIAGSEPAAEAEDKGAKAKSRSLEPPEWLGWALLSLGSVLILHSMAMKRPE